ncbi:MAG: hypothetical protein U0Q16_12300 [Bryobacteraceae bacterium]
MTADMLPRGRTLALACFIAVLVGCGGTGPRSILDASLADLVPNDAIRLVDLRVDRLKTSPVYDRFKPLLEQQSLEGLAKETGFDPRKDLDEVLLVSDGKGMFGLARGRFDRASIEKRLAESGAKRADVGSVVAFALGQRLVALPAATVIAGGDDAIVRAALDRAAKKQPFPAHLAKLMNPVPAGAHAWAVSYGALEVPGDAGGPAANVAKILGSVDTGTLWADLSRGVRLGAVGTASDEAGAKKLHGAMRGIVGLGRLSIPDGKEDLKKVFDAVDIRQESKQVRLSADVPLEAVNEIADMLAKFGRGN